MMTWNQLGVQDGFSSFMLELSEFHDYVMMLLVMILVWVGAGMASICWSNYCDRQTLEHQTVEWAWTVLPMGFLVLIALPSLRLVYIGDEGFDYGLSVKVVGHQWYWSYEYSDFKDVSYDSYMVGEDDLMVGDFRCLEVDNRVVVPSGMSVRFLITSGDVIHSWAVPSLGLKVDAVPGRLNQLSADVGSVGVFYGQCSEICGANHSFMPIVVESIDLGGWVDWLSGWTGE